MEIALLCIAATAGICAWGFLLAGAIAFHDASNTPVRGVRSILLILDILVSLGLFTMLFVVVRNWNRKPGGEKLGLDRNSLCDGGSSRRNCANKLVIDE